MRKSQWRIRTLGAHSDLSGRNWSSFSILPEIVILPSNILMRLLILKQAYLTRIRIQEIVRIKDHFPLDHGYVSIVLFNHEIWPSPLFGEKLIWLSVRCLMYALNSWNKSVASVEFCFISTVQCTQLNMHCFECCPILFSWTCIWFGLLWLSKTLFMFENNY